jgi:hypothetical protein
LTIGGHADHIPLLNRAKRRRNPFSSPRPR